MTGVAACIDFYKKCNISLHYKFLTTMIIATSEVLKPTLTLMNSQINDSECLSSNLI